MILLTTSSSLLFFFTDIVYMNCEPPKYIFIECWNDMDDTDIVQLCQQDSQENQCTEYYTPTKQQRNDLSSQETVLDDDNVPVPMEIAAVSDTTSHVEFSKKTNTDDSILSPSSYTRNKTTRKRTTPEKYIPFSANTTSISKKKKPGRPQGSTSSKFLHKSPDNIVDNDDSVAVIQDTIPVLSDDIIIGYERDAVAKRLLSDNDADNVALSDVANESEDRFLRSLFKITMRNASNISWGGFVLGYIREIRLNDWAKEYFKTCKY